MPSAWTVVDRVDDNTAAEVHALLEAIEHRTGDEALTEAQRERLDGGAQTRHALRRGPDDAIDGYAVVVDGPVLEVEPALGTYDDALSRLFESDHRPVAMLLRNVGVDDEASLLAAGWRPSRTLHRLCRPLPAPPPPPAPDGITMRPFAPGLDNDVWIAQNNAAFAGHPSQAEMTLERLRARIRAAWFDADGFLMFFDGDALAASCWTKIHSAPERGVGEIYVISVAPFAQGRGLGKLAVLEGLAYLAGRGLAEAELYVEADNDAANRLYERLGFTYAARIVEFRRGPDIA